MKCGANHSLMESQESSQHDLGEFSERKQSAGHSKFQRIGWILKIIEESVGCFDDLEGSLADFDGALEALEKYAGLGEDECEYLLALTTHQDRFEYVWRLLNEEEREIAIQMDYTQWQNFWPGFETFQMRALQYAPTGSLESPVESTDTR